MSESQELTTNEKFTLAVMFGGLSQVLGVTVEELVRRFNTSSYRVPELGLNSEELGSMGIDLSVHPKSSPSSSRPEREANVSDVPSKSDSKKLNVSWNDVSGTLYEIFPVVKNLPGIRGGSESGHDAASGAHVLQNASRRFSLASAIGTSASNPRYQSCVRGMRNFYAFSKDSKDNQLFFGTLLSMLLHMSRRHRRDMAGNTLCTWIHNYKQKCNHRPRNDPAMLALIENWDEVTLIERDRAVSPI